MSHQQYVLIVDDEVEILNSLKRLLKSTMYTVDTTNSPAEALKMLQSKDYSVIISDFRMPQMSGVDFLEKSQDIRPDAFRILLTGFADLQSTLGAINKGGVYRVLTKPWRNEELFEVVESALQHHYLIRENDRLTILSQKQNEELSALNKNLEKKVKERTAQISQLNSELQERFLNSIQLLINIVQVHNKAGAGHSMRVAKLAAEIASQQKLPAEDILTIEVAALLHDIGKIGLPPELLRKNPYDLKAGEKKLIATHPALGWELLREVGGFEAIAKIVRHHHESFNGEGYPDQLKGTKIPLGSRIIAVANAYDNYVNNAIEVECLTSDDALITIKEECPKHFDFEIVKHLTAILEKGDNFDPEVEMEVQIQDLKAGMVLSKNLILASGRQLLPKDTVIQERYLSKIESINKIDPVIDRIYIYINK